MGGESRRAFLTILGTTGVGTLAGCSTLQNDGRDRDPTPTERTATPTPANPTIRTTQTKLLAADGTEDAVFGREVTLSADGTTALIGAPLDGRPSGSRSGSAYVFVRSEEGWTQQSKLVPRDSSSEDEFGSSIALSGNGELALVGATDDDNRFGKDAGAAYAFKRDGDTWRQETKLFPPNGRKGDLFGGVSISADGQTAMIGSYDAENANESGSGVGYMFSRSDGTWTHQAELVPDGFGQEGGFGGGALSADGSTALIGDAFAEDGNGRRVGVAYLFTREGDSWSQQTILTPPDGFEGSTFGNDLSLTSQGEMAVIGAGEASSGGTVERGAAYVFTGTDGTWSRTAELTATDGDEDDSFGDSVAISGDGTTILGGAPFDENPNGEDAGSAYRFERIDGTWVQQAKLLPSDGRPDARFGTVSLSRDGATGLVGAYRDDNQNGDHAGAAYVF